MSTHPQSVAHWNSAGQSPRTLRYFSMWTVAMAMSLICAVWGLDALFSGNINGPDSMSLMHAALMSTLGLICFGCALLGNYLRGRTTPRADFRLEHERVPAAG